MNLDITELSEKRRRWVEINRENNFEQGLNQLLTQLYPDNAHFVYELLQNAEDAKATEVKFVLKPDCIEFTHNGTKLFSMEDIDAITSIGNTNKQNDYTNIGKFGVGFKAVFSYTKTPEIRSGHFHFRIRNLVVPEIDGLSSPTVEKKITQFSFLFNNPNKPPERCLLEIKRNLQELDENTLLFLKHIRKINYILPDNSIGTLERTEEQDKDNLIKILHKVPASDFPHENFFLRFDRTVEVLDEEGIQRECRISIAYSMERSPKNANDWRIIPIKSGKACIYFPAVKETSKLLFHLHAPFASSVARDSIRDCPSNDALRNQLADLFVDSLTFIRDHDWLTVNFLGVLPNLKDDLSPFYQPFLDRAIKAFRDTALLPMKRGGYARAKGVFRGPRLLSELINDEDLAILTLSPKSKSLWVANTSLRNQRESNFLDSLDVEEWGWKKLIRKIIGYNNLIIRVIKNKSDEWHQRFYALLHKYLESLSSYKRKNHLKTISSINLIRLDSGVYAKGENCFFPENNNGFEYSFPIVAKGILKTYKNEVQQETAKKFLVKTGVRDVGDEVKMEIYLKRMYSENSSKYEGFDPNIHDIVHFINSLKRNPQLATTFQKFRIFKRRDGKWCTPLQVYIDYPYLNTGLKDFYDAIEESDLDYEPLSQEYLTCAASPHEIGEFAKKVGARNYLEITTHEDSMSNKIDYSIEFLEKAIENITIKISKLIWNALEYSENHSIDSNPPLHYKKKKTTYGKIKDNGDSMLIELLKSSKWVPQVSDSLFFVKPSNASIQLLPKGFTYDSGWHWLPLVGFGVTFKADQEKTDEQIKSEEYVKENYVKLLGFDSMQEIKRIADFKKNNPKVFEQMMHRFKENHSFPEKNIKNAERRTSKLKEQLSEAPEIVYKEKKRTVRDSSSRIDPGTWLKNEYTNRDGIMMCQICKEEMPFKKRNGEYYFEAVELLSKHNFSKEYEAHYIALCPLCAAMYKEWVKKDKTAMQRLKEMIMKSDNPEIPILLGELETTLRFVETHFQSIKIILNASQKKSENEN